MKFDIKICARVDKVGFLNVKQHARTLGSFLGSSVRKKIKIVIRIAKLCIEC